MQNKDILLFELIDIIGSIDPFQKKSIRKLLEETNQIRIENIEIFAEEYLSYLINKGFSLNEIAFDYIWMCKEIMREQIRFMKEGKYKYSKIDQVIEKVYYNRNYMEKYMIGVGVSQMLWKNHNFMYSFWNKHLEKWSGKIYLEIGVGHGMFFKTALKHHNFSNYIAVDISKTSLNMTRDLVGGLNHTRNITYILDDVMNIDNFRNSIDFVTMGEVLEHVEYPYKLVAKIHDMLSPTGRAYISTCANAPVIDHIYLFNNIEEIRTLLTEYRLNIVDEMIICNDETPKEFWDTKKANLSYAAICEK